MLHYFCCILTGVERHQWRDSCTCKQKVPFCQTEEAEPWMLQENLEDFLFMQVKYTHKIHRKKKHFVTLSSE